MDLHVTNGPLLAGEPQTGMSSLCGFCSRACMRHVLWLVAKCFYVHVDRPCTKPLVPVDGPTGRGRTFALCWWRLHTEKPRPGQDGTERGPEGLGKCRDYSWYLHWPETRLQCLWEGKKWRGGTAGVAAGGVTCSWLCLAVPAFVCSWRNVGRKRHGAPSLVAQLGLSAQTGQPVMHGRPLFPDVLGGCFVLPRGGVLCAEACSQPN